jgi:hypothetical protein
VEDDNGDAEPPIIGAFGALGRSSMEIILRSAAGRNRPSLVMIGNPGRCGNPFSRLDTVWIRLTRPLASAKIVSRM